MSKNTDKLDQVHDLGRRLRDAEASEKEYREMAVSRLERLEKAEKELAKADRLRKSIYHNLAQEYLELHARTYRVGNRITALGYKVPRPVGDEKS